MGEELHWGAPVVGYLFLAGLSAGSLTVSASVLLRGGAGGFGGAHFALARYGALLSPVPVLFGCFLLVFELGQPWRFLNLYKVMNLSPMSAGTWFLTLFIWISIAYAVTFLVPNAGPGDRWHPWRRGLAWIGVPSGIAVAIYTGVLLGAMPARPFWNTPILALLFLLSSISTGVAMIMLARTAFHRRTGIREDPELYHQSGYILTASDLLLIGFELLVVFLFIMYAHLTIGSVKEAIQVILPGGELAALFWIAVVAVGLLAPGLAELIVVVPKLLYHRAFAVPVAVEWSVPVTVLIGGLMLRYVVVVAGQVTGPAGI